MPQFDLELCFVFLNEEILEAEASSQWGQEVEVHIAKVFSSACCGVC